MATLNAIKQRLAQAKTAENAPVLAVLEQQNYHAQLSADTVEKLCVELGLSPVELALKCLPLAAAYAKPPVSNFYVGAVAIGQSGAFYFGANQEFVVGMPHTIHAEQSAISHCWLAGEKGVTDVVVNYTPCGHC